MLHCRLPITVHRSLWSSPTLPWHLSHLQNHVHFPSIKKQMLLCQVIHKEWFPVCCILFCLFNGETIWVPWQKTVTVRPLLHCLIQDCLQKCTSKQLNIQLNGIFLLLFATRHWLFVPKYSGTQPKVGFHKRHEATAQVHIVQFPNALWQVQLKIILQQWLSPG